MGGGNQTNLRAGLRRRASRPAFGMAQRGVRRSAVIGLLGVVALVSASCAGGPQHHVGADAVSHQAGARVKTDPAIATTTTSSTTTTTAPAPGVKTNASTFTPAAVPAPAPAPTTTTTTDPFPPACVWSNFTTKVSTDQGAYSPGQAVQITLVFANAGPACTVNTSGYGCPRVNVDNSAGALVWSNAAPSSTGCPAAFIGPTVLPANWSQNSAYSWGQDTCTPGQAACPGPPVSPGQYQVTGRDGGGSSQIPAATPVAITLNAG